MKAAVLHGVGPPEAFRIEDVPTPSLDVGQALVRVGACGVSSRDIVERNGTYRRDVEFPLIMGLEIAGTVVEVDDRCRTISTGDRVCTKAFASCGHCRLCRNGRETTCFERRPVRGGYGTFAALDADALVTLPASISYEHGCGAGPAAGVALNAVRDIARVTIDETVLITGASGGVGSAAVQIARNSGARVIATTRSRAKINALREDGADDVVVHGPEIVSEVHELTRGAGVDVVIDTVGSDVFEDCFDCLAVHGRYALVGELRGRTQPINPARVFFKRAQLLGVGSVSRSQLEDTLHLIEGGRLRTRVATVLPLEQVARAHRLVESAQLVGRVILNPQS